MKYQFNVTLNDQDYLEFNIFLHLRTERGKKRMNAHRIKLTIMFAIAAFVILYLDDFSLIAIIGIMPLIIYYLLIQIFMRKIHERGLKKSILNTKKTGKPSYSPESVLEFYEDCFKETTPETKMEHNYSAIEGISVVDNKMIYLHINENMVVQVPLSCFESKEQQDSFLEFVKAKCANMEIRYYIER